MEDFMLCEFHIILKTKSKKTTPQNLRSVMETTYKKLGCEGTVMEDRARGQVLKDGHGF